MTREIFGFRLYSDGSLELWTGSEKPMSNKDLAEVLRLVADSIEKGDTTFAMLEH